MVELEIASNSSVAPVIRKYISEWLNENFGDNWKFVVENYQVRLYANKWNYTIVFENENEMVFFKLRWL
jgi:hypothetical protein